MNSKVLAVSFAFVVLLAGVLPILTGCASDMTTQEKEKFYSELYQKFPKPEMYREAYEWLKEKGNNKPSFTVQHFTEGWYYAKMVYLQPSGPYPTTRIKLFLEDRAFMDQLYGDMDAWVAQQRDCCHASSVRIVQEWVEMRKRDYARVMGDAASVQASQDELSRIRSENRAERERLEAQGQALNALATSAVAVAAATRPSSNQQALPQQQAAVSSLSPSGVSQDNRQGNQPKQQPQAAPQQPSAQVAQNQANRCAALPSANHKPWPEAQRNGAARCSCEGGQWRSVGKSFTCFIGGEATWGCGPDPVNGSQCGQN